jgi:superfamily II DNA or RNA helicase
LKVLITTYDVGSVGLDLHKACNCVILTAPGRSWSQEAQAAGRALRVCQMSFFVGAVTWQLGPRTSSS